MQTKFEIFWHSILIIFSCAMALFCDAVLAANTPPIILDRFPNSINIKEDEKEELYLADYVTDDGDAPQDIYWKAVDSQHIHVDIEGSKATFTSTEKDWCGTEDVVLIAIDGGDLSTNVTLSITFTCINDPPRIIQEKFPSDIRIDEDKSYALLLANKAQDVDNELKDITWSEEGSKHIHVEIHQNNLAIFTSTEPNWYGAEDIKLTATDKGGLSDAINLTVTFTSVNDPPEILGQEFPQEIKIQKDKPTHFSLEGKVKDADNKPEEIDWSVRYSNNIQVDIQGNTATFSLKDDWRNPKEWVALTATDSDGGSDTITLPVTFPCIPPEILKVKFPQDGIVTNEDTPVEFSLSDVVKEDDDNKPDEIQWSGIDSDHIRVEIQGQQAIFSSKQQHWWGKQNISLTATNRCGLSDTIILSVTFTPVNDPPEILKHKFPPEIIIKDGQEVTLYLADKVEDVDDKPQDIQWTAKSNKHIHVELQSNTATFILQEQGWWEVEDIILIATDSRGASVEISIPVASKCTPVILHEQFPLVIEEDKSITIDLSNKVIDRDSGTQDITWNSRDSEHIQVIISGSQATFKSKQENWHGAEMFSLTVKDSDGLTDTIVLTITFEPVPDAPQILKEQLKDEFSEPTRKGTSRAVTLYDKVKDDDDKPEAIKWDVLKSKHIKVDIVNGIANFSASNEDWYGIEEIFLTATDSDALSDIIDILVTIISDPPKILPAKFPKPVVFISGQSYTLPLSDTVDDENPENIIWEAQNSANVHVSVSESGAIFTAKNFFDGEEYVTLIAKDEDGQTDSIILPVKVMKAPIITMPNWMLCQNQLYLPGTIPDKRTVTWNFLPGSHVKPINFANDILKFDVEPDDWFGTEVISWTATDNDGLSTSASFTVIALPKTLKFDENVGGAEEFIVPYLMDENGVPYTLEWIAEDGGSKHIEIDISGRIATFSARAEVGENWSGTERIHFKVTDKNSGRTESCFIDVTFSHVPELPLPDISLMPCWVLWNTTVGALSFADKVKNTDKIEWAGGGGEIHPKAVNPDGKTVMFDVPDPLLAAKVERINYTASNSSGKRDGSFTIVVLPTRWVIEEHGDTLTLASNVDCHGRAFKLVWSLPFIEPNPPIVAELSEEPWEVRFHKKGLGTTNISTEGTDTENIHTYTVDIEVVATEAAPAIMVNRFALQNGFSIKDGSLTLKMKENSSVEVSLADKVEFSGDVAVNLRFTTKSEQIAWTSNRSKHIDVKIDSERQVATFIPETNWNSGSAEQKEMVQLTAVNQAGYSDTVPIAVIVTPALHHSGNKSNRNNEGIPVGIDKNALFGNFPNPFNSETWIPYQLAKESDVVIRIYDGKGQLVRTINLERQAAGRYVAKDKAAHWDGRSDTGENVASGLYFCTLQVGPYTATKKMVILK